MNANKDKIFNRLNGLLDHGKDRVHTLTDELEDRIRTEAQAMAERARGGLKHGREQLHTAEEMMMRNMKDHPVFYILGALSLLGLFVAISRLFFDQRTRRPWENL